MELNDCAFPLLAGVSASDSAETAFQDADYALLVGARPRGKGMERKDLLAANGAIFGPQGQALNAVASRAVKVLVVGNPANTNALIAMRSAPDLAPEQFTAMTRLDHNRALSLLAEQTGLHVNQLRRMIIWGNHSATQYPDISHCLADGRPAAERVDQGWYRDTYIPKVQQRGAEIIQARGASSAASAASAAIDHMRSWALGTPDDDWGQYGGTVRRQLRRRRRVSFILTRVPAVAAGIISYRVWRSTISAASGWQITERELREERAGVEDLL